MSGRERVECSLALVLVAVNGRGADADLGQLLREPVRAMLGPDTVSLAACAPSGYRRPRLRITR